MFPNQTSYITNVRVLSLADNDVTDTYLKIESAQTIKYDIKSINKRFNKLQKEAKTKIELFSAKIKNAIALCNHHLHAQMISIILLYSNHQQIIDEWYRICKKLGPFAYLISENKGCSIDKIIQLEKQWFNRFKISSLPCSLRISLMICNSLNFPAKFISYKLSYNNYPPECEFNSIQRWQLTPTFLFDEDCFSDNETDTSIAIDMTKHALFDEINMDFWQGTSIDQKHLISFGQNVWYINSVLGMREQTVEVIWNTCNNKILVIKSDEFMDSNVYDLEHWLFHQISDYNAIFDHCFVDWTDNTFEDWDYMTKYISIKFNTIIEIYSRTHQDMDMDQFKWFYHFYVYKLYEKKYSPLVEGFTRENSANNVPECVTRLILSYYPLFISNDVKEEDEDIDFYFE